MIGCTKNLESIYYITKHTLQTTIITGLDNCSQQWHNITTCRQLSFMNWSTHKLPTRFFTAICYYTSKYFLRAGFSTCNESYIYLFWFSIFLFRFTFFRVLLLKVIVFIIFILLLRTFIRTFIWITFFSFSSLFWNVFTRRIRIIVAFIIRILSFFFLITRLLRVLVAFIICILRFLLLFTGFFWWFKKICFLGLLLVTVLLITY